MKSSNTLLALGLWICAMTAQAVPITLVGDNINYVYDDSQAAALAVLGTPTIVGDLVYFSPATFRAQSLDGDPSGGSVGADFVFSSVYNNQGGTVGLVQVSGIGNYGLANSAAVTYNLGIELNDNNSDGTASTGDSGGDAGHYSSAQIWQLAAGVDASAAVAGPATDIGIILRTGLTANSAGQSSVAWIQGNFISLTVAPGAMQPPGSVPAPDVLLLLGLGLLAIAGARHVKSQ